MTENFEKFDIITADDTNHFSLGNSPGEKVLKNPASVYLLSLDSKFSRKCSDAFRPVLRFPFSG